MAPTQVSDDLEAVAVDRGHRGGNDIGAAGVVMAEGDECVGVIGVHVADDPGRVGPEGSGRAAA